MDDPFRVPNLCITQGMEASNTDNGLEEDRKVKVAIGVVISAIVGSGVIAIRFASFAFRLMTVLSVWLAMYHSLFSRRRTIQLNTSLESS